MSLWTMLINLILAQVCMDGWKVSLPHLLLPSSSTLHNRLMIWLLLLLCYYEHQRREINTAPLSPLWWIILCGVWHDASTTSILAHELVWTLAHWHTLTTDSGESTRVKAPKPFKSRYSTVLHRIMRPPLLRTQKSCGVTIFPPSFWPKSK